MAASPVYDADPPASDIDTLVEAAVRSDNPREHSFARGLIFSAFRERKEPWGAALIAKARSLAWGDTALMTILQALPNARWTWDQVAAIGSEFETAYWRRAPVFWMSKEREDVAYAIRRLIDVGRARHAMPLTGATGDLPTELLIELLEEAAQQPFERDGDHNEGTMFQHYVAETLGVLDQRRDVVPGALVGLEWKYLKLLEHRRPAKNLLRALSDQPPLFVVMLSAVFRPSEGSGVIEPEPVDPAQARAVADQAYRLLSRWNRLPGTREDGTVDGQLLEAWITQARSLAKAVGREDAADDQIGTMLSASPMGGDGHWPAEPVREALDRFRSKAMLTGFEIGKRNRRGVTSRSLREGGEQERQLSAQFRAWAKAIRFDHPHTAKALDGIAERYDWDARREDEDAERLDWEV